MEHLPVPATQACRPGRDERRVMCRALSRWQIMAEDGRLPLDGTVLVTAEDELSPYTYLVRLAPDIRDSLMEYCGQVLAELCDGAAAGRPVREVLPLGLRDRMTDFLLSAARYRMALADSGSFLTRGGTEVLYRNIVMPMQSAEGAVVSVLGAFSYRIER